MGLVYKFCLLVMLCVVDFSVNADVVVIVSAKSSVGQMDKDQVSDIFLSKSSNYPDGQQAVPIEVERGDGLRDEFHDKVTGKSTSQLKSYWSKMVFSGKGTPPKEVLDGKAVLKLIGSNPNLIGYIDRGSIDKSVKIVFAP